MSGRTTLAALALASAAWLGSPSDASAASEHGAVIVDGAEKVAPARYKVPKDKDWDKTIRFYRTLYGKTAGVVFRMMATPPEVKAIHIENTKVDRTWEGINIYETGGDIFVYVIAAEAGSKPAKAGRQSHPRSNR